MSPWTLLDSVCGNDDRYRRASGLLLVATGCLIAVLASLAILAVVAYLAFGWVPVASTGGVAVLAGITTVLRRRLPETPRQDVPEPPDRA